VREAIASRFMNMFDIPGEHNLADILSKHWDYPQIWLMLQAILFYQGNTMDLTNDSKLSHGLQTYGE
jgi:hypothetical protein